jgi:hypothetical protein
MRAAFLASAALLAAAVHAQSPQGAAVETGKTQPAACHAAGLKAASMAQGLEIALQRSDGRSPPVYLAPCECQEKAQARGGSSWTCTRRWTLQARQR